MIPHGVEVFVCLVPVDLRWSFDRLAGIVREHVGRDPRSRALFVLFGKRRSAMKIFFFDGSGLCQLYKRLDRGCFRMPDVDGTERYVEIDERQLDDLMDGIELDQGPRPPRGTRVH